jgi:hypothetical protein
MRSGRWLVLPDHRQPEEIHGVLQLLEGPDDAGLGGGAARLLPAGNVERGFHSFT